MKPPKIAVESVVALGEPCLRSSIPEKYEDANGHMNVRWYAAIFDEAGDVLYERLRLTPEFKKAHSGGTMDLENHFHYLSEVLIGDRVAVYARIVGRSAKRFHYLMFLVDETRGTLASIFECVNAYVDMTLRKTAPYPPEIAATIDAAVAASEALDWPAPICGAMQA
jgi:acyl-CoA thioester hydrolase